MGGIPAWFEIHMALGVVGPILVLFHANFKLGATNSNVALICMLLVAGSGVIGRYIYTRLHARMDGHEDTLEQFKAVGDRLRSQTTSIAFLPGLLDAIDRVEQRWIEPPEGALGPVLASVHRRRCASRSRAGSCGGTIKRAVRRGRAEPAIRARTAMRRGSPRSARSYAYRRLEAGRRMPEYRLYAQLFSLWHVLHIPLFFMLLIAGIVHVMAVNVY